MYEYLCPNKAYAQALPPSDVDTLIISCLTPPLQLLILHAGIRKETRRVRRVARRCVISYDGLPLPFRPEFSFITQICVATREGQGTEMEYKEEFLIDACVWHPSDVSSVLGPMPDWFSWFARGAISIFAMPWTWVSVQRVNHPDCVTAEKREQGAIPLPALKGRYLIEKRGEGERQV
ncbi:uncharacterized protein BT62DRAFT_1080382, partial [Guyanagaster necrorhizus]